MAVNGIEIEVGQKWVTTKARIVQVIAPAVGWVRGSPWKPEFVLDDGYYVSNDGKLSTPSPESLDYRVRSIWQKHSGESGNLVFPDISSADHAAGRVEISKLFPPVSEDDSAAATAPAGTRWYNLQRGQALTDEWEQMVGELFGQIKGAGVTPQRRDTDKKDLSEYETAERAAAVVDAAAQLVASGGGKLDRKSNYYQVQIERPVDPQSEPYLAECADVIEALNMTFNEGEAFKALWRLAAARLGKTKAGGNPVYDADKAAHYGARTAAQTRAQHAVAK